METVQDAKSQKEQDGDGDGKEEGVEKTEAGVTEEADMFKNVKECEDESHGGNGDGDVSLFAESL